MGTIQARTHYTSGLTPCLDWTHTQGWTGLTLWAGLERRWICTNEVWTPLVVSRGWAITALVLVTKLHQVNKTVFVFFPCVKLIFPRLDDVILHFHPVVASTSTFTHCILLCIAQHVINTLLSLWTESFVVYNLTLQHSLNHGSKLWFYLSVAKKIK